MSTFYVDPTANAGGNGTQNSPFNSWSQVQFVAGSTYLQKAGTTTSSGGLYVGVKGTSAAPITIGAYGAGAAPTITGQVTLDNTAYLTFSGLTVTGNTGGAAMVIQNGTNHVTVQNNTLQNSRMGMWIGNNAGGSNLITSNSVLNNSNDGIAISGVINVVGQETTISHNTISGNGSHGIEISGNRFIIDSNYVSGNGANSPGASGIHTYATSASDNEGNYNTITNNVTVNTHDTQQTDGNGIELDQWTHNNTVSGNFSYANDGAGIVIYDSYANAISNNFMGGNELDPGHTHVARGDLALNDSSVKGTHNNTFSGNTALSVNSTTPAIFVDPSATTQSNSFANDVFENLSGGPVYNWGGTIGSSQSQWNQYVSPTDKFSGVQMFANSGFQGTYNYTFPAGTNAAIDGHNVQIIGWAAGQGLGVNYLS